MYPPRQQSNTMMRMTPSPQQQPGSGGMLGRGSSGGNKFSQFQKPPMMSGGTDMGPKPPGMMKPGGIGPSMNALADKYGDAKPQMSPSFGQPMGQPPPQMQPMMPPPVPEPQQAGSIGPSPDIMEQFLSQRQPQDQYNPRMKMY